jgi:CBS domain-containing membrane protein
MSRDVVRVLASTPAREAWQLMIRHAVKALPVVDARNALQGIVTLHDFFVGHEVASTASGIDAWRVADVMTRDALTATPDQELVDLVQAFSNGGRHHLPVVGSGGELVGMVTQSDMVAALFRAGLERPLEPA